MKRSILIAGILTTLSMPTMATRLETGAIVDRDMRGRTIDSLVTIVKGYGYRCDTVSAALPMVFTKGYTLTCNNSTYHYEIQDIGGRIRVKAQ